MKLKDIYEESGRKSRFWIVHPDIFRAAGNCLGWNKSAMGLVVQPIFSTMQICRTMRTKQILPDGTKTCPAMYQPPSTIVVEECSFETTLPIATTVEQMGKVQSKKIFDQGLELGILAGHNQATLNMDEHRKGVLTAFNWRNNTFLNPREPLIFGTVENVKKSISPSGRVIRQSQQGDKDEAETRPTVRGLDEVDTMLYGDNNCGLELFYYLTREDESVNAPALPSSYYRYLGYYSPIITRCLELAFKYCKQNRERLVVYVDDAWIQW